jgi:hypothetical protein
MRITVSSTAQTKILASLVLVISLFCAWQVSAQPQASGGKVSTAPATTTKPAPKPTTTKRPSVTSNKPRTPTPPVTRTDATAANIAGKWWTTGNGFGDSEVVFSQNGSEVSGVIRYADGRTGSVNGKMVGKRLQHSWTNSSGQGGTGWLELSWSNFLGGPWRNAQTRDGSWTLSRIEGNWCFGVCRYRFRQVCLDAQGRISLVTEDGTPEEGQLEGPWLYLHSDFGSIKGEMNYKHNRVTWSTGFYWTWCGR